jgi:hypothetical protein
MIDSLYTGRPIPQTEHRFLMKIIEAKALTVDGGITKRKASSIAHMTSEQTLLKYAERCGFGIVRAGTHYLIFNGHIAFETLLASFAMASKE